MHLSPLSSFWGAFQYSGIETKRPWPIAPTKEVLKERWATLVSSVDKQTLMKESNDRTVEISSLSLLPPYIILPPISSLQSNTPPLKIDKYGFRSFDRQWILADNRIISRPRIPLWYSHGEKQLYLASSLPIPLSNGPGLTVSAIIPDLHYFCNRGGKDIIPLFRDSDTKEPNLAPGILRKLTIEYGKQVSAEDVACYVYAVLAHPEYTMRFNRELGSREVRVPLTKKADLFFRAVELGKHLIWLHTYGERFAGEGRKRESVSPGKAKCLKAVPEEEEKYPNEFRYDEERKTILVGEGEFGPVEPEIFHFEVSGFKVVKSWLGYRMKERSGKKSSPLDDIRPRSWTREFTRELLELLWVLEKTVAGYPKQIKLFEEILDSPLFLASELPPVPEESRKPPSPLRRGAGDQHEIAFEEEDS